MSNVIKHTKADRVFTVISYLVILLVMIITIYPLYYVLIVSISDGVAVSYGKVNFYPIGINFGAYEEVFQYPRFFTSYRNTIVYTLIGTLVNLTMSSLCAYPLSRKNFYGRNVFSILIVITMFFSGGLIPSYMLVRALGLLDTMWALILPGAINTWNMIVMRTFFQSIPDDLYESASLDGANEAQVLWKIVLPLSGPIFSTMAIFYAVGHWNSYFNALIYLTDNDKFPLQLILRSVVLVGESTSNAGKQVTSSSLHVLGINIKYATIVVAVLPILAIYPFFQRYFVKGMMVGALKG